MKPILHVIIKKRVANQSYHNNLDILAHALKRTFGKSYALVATPDDVDIIADNTTVVNLTIHPSTDIGRVAKQLNEIAEDCNEEVNNSDSPAEQSSNN